MAKVVDPYYEKRAKSRPAAGRPAIGEITLPPMANLPTVSGSGYNVLPGTPVPTDDEIKAKLAQNQAIVAAAQNDVAKQEQGLEAFKASLPQFHGAPYAAPLDAGTEARLRGMSQPVSGGGGGEFDPSSPRMQNLRAAGNAPTPAATQDPTVPFDPKLMEQIVANRQAAEAARAAKLKAEGMSPEAIDARMFPQHGVTPDPVKQQARAIDLAERNGRVNVRAMADRLMRQAHMNGQQMPIAQAYAIAMGQMNTTDPMNQGAVPSLPGMDPQRMAGFMSPAAGAVAGQYDVGMGANANQATRDQLQNNLGMAQVQQQGQNQQQTIAQQLLQMALNHSIAQQQQNTNAAVASNAMGPSPAMQQQTAARQQLTQLLTGPNHMAQMATSPEYRQMVQSLQAAAYGGVPGLLGGQVQSTPPAASPPAGGAPAPAPAPASLGSAFNGVPAGVTSSPAAMQQWLSMAPESDRARLEAMARLQAGDVNHPSVYNYVTSQYASEDPNLYTGIPDSWMHSYNGSDDPGLIQGALGLMFPNAMAPRAQKAAQHVSETMGIPYDQALQIMTRHFNR